jgi:hypothetical protein
VVVGQQPGRANRRGVDRGRVDRHVLNRSPELVAAFAQPADHGLTRAAGTLTQQPLVAGQVDKPGVPRVAAHPPPSRLAAFPAGLAAAGLINAKHPGGLRLGQLGGGVGDERAVRSRPRHPVGGGDLGHGPRRVTDRCADLGAQPSGGPSPARDLWNRFGKRSPPAIILPAPPPRLVPPHDDSVLAVGNVARRGPYPSLHRPRDHPARRTRRGRFLRCHHIHHTSPVRRTLNTLDTYSWQPEQQCRTVRHGPWFPSTVRKCRNSQTSEGQGPPHTTTRPMRAKSQLPH